MLRNRSMMNRYDLALFQEIGAPKYCARAEEPAARACTLGTVGCGSMFQSRATKESKRLSQGFVIGRLKTPQGPEDEVLLN